MNFCMSYQTNFWNKYFSYYDVLLKVIPYQNLFSRIISNLRLSPNLKILDLGSGTGNLQNYLPDNLKVVNLDNSEEALNRLKMKFPSAITIKHSILQPLPFDDNSFDRIVSNNVLYTLKKEEWQFVVSEIKRISKPKAIIVISNLNQDFKAVNIYKDHIKKCIVKKGIVKTIRELTQLIYPTIQMLRFNKKINKCNDMGRYSFLQEEEQRHLFEQFQLKSIGNTESVYSKQAYLNVFINKKEK